MDKRILWLVGFLAGLIVFVKTPLIAALLAFFILGIVPGTDILLPPWVLMIIYPVLFVAVLYRISTQPFIWYPAARTAVKPKAPTNRRKSSTKMKPAAAASRKRRASQSAV